MRIKDYLYIIIVLLTGLWATSCTEEIDMNPNEGKIMIEGRIANFIVNGEPSAIEGENNITEMKACIFTDGVLTKVYDNINVGNGNFNLNVTETSGTLYMVGNATDAGAWHDMSINSLSEDEWKLRTVSMKDNKAVSFFTGSVSLDGYINGESAPLVLTRGVARFDLNIPTEGGVALNSIRLENVASKAFLLPQSSVTSPETDFVTLEESFTTPLTEGKSGLFYVYEQASANMKVVIDVTVDGTKKILEADIPERGIKRNAVYTMNIHSSSINIHVDEWEYEEDINLSPDYTGKITVDMEKSVLQGAVVTPDGTGLNIPYLSSEMELYLNSDNELEAVYDGDEIITVYPIENANGETERNGFRIVKRLSPIGYEARPSIIRFRRKGMTEIYDEDCIVLTMEENPTKTSGLLMFDLDGVCDFGKYVDNGLGSFKLEEGKELIVDLGNEDPWIKAEIDDSIPNIYHIIAGWRPNDPKGDGREQAAKIIIRNKLSDGRSATGTEEYIIKRRNWSIPVVQLNGIWWSKYNMRGDARKYEDQVLVSTDPAEKAGKSLFEYLNSCTSEEYFQVIGSAYQSDSSQGLLLTYSDGKWHFPGFVSHNSQVMSEVDKKKMAPDGFELPDKESFRSLVWDYNCSIGNKPTDGFGNTPRGNLMFAERSDITQNGGTMSVHHHVIYYTESRYSTTRVSDEFVLYGPGYQASADSEATNLYIFYATNTEENGLWTLRCNNGNTFRFENYSSNSEDKTHTIRCIKTPVDYQY